MLTHVQESRRVLGAPHGVKLLQLTVGAVTVLGGIEKAVTLRAECPLHVAKAPVDCTAQLRLDEEWFM